MHAIVNRRTWLIATRDSVVLTGFAAQAISAAAGMGRNLDACGFAPTGVCRRLRNAQSSSMTVLLLQNIAGRIGVVRTIGIMNAEV